MARTARRDAPGAVHHVLLRGIERRDIFRIDADREDFLARLDRLVPEAGASCLAWALIPNHVHLVLRTGHQPLSELMRCLNTGYARAFNLRHGRVGYVFQNRFGSILVEDDAYLRTLVRYVHLNPLRAGIVGSLAELANYRWAGHAALMGRGGRTFHSVTEVLAWFGDEPAAARAGLADWMRQGLKATDAALPRPARGSFATAGQGVSGSAIRPEHDPVRRDPPAGRAGALRARGWTLEALVDWVCASTGVDASRLRAGGRTRVECQTRAVIGVLATRELGYTVLDVSRAAGVGAGAMSRAIRRQPSRPPDQRWVLPPAPPQRWR